MMTKVCVIKIWKKSLCDKNENKSLCDKNEDKKSV